MHARRLLRLSQSCDVLPSLAAAAELAPSRADLDTFILRLSLQNLQAGTPLHAPDQPVWTC